jgi:site-specific recombinase XerD
MTAEGLGPAVVTPECFDAMEAWLAAGKISEGAVFRQVGKGDHVKRDELSDKAIAKIVKRYAAAAGLDPKLFSGHSLRAGFVTSALEHGADIFKVMNVTRHRRERRSIFEPNGHASLCERSGAG